MLIRSLIRTRRTLSPEEHQNQHIVGLNWKSDKNKRICVPQSEPVGLSLSLNMMMMNVKQQNRVSKRNDASVPNKMLKK